MLLTCVVVGLLSLAAVESTNSFSELVEFHANYGRTSSGRKNVTAVSAADLWAGDQLLKLLGIEESDFTGDDVDLHRNKIEVPSILRALYNKMKDPAVSNVVPQKCKIPGMKGNVIRFFRSTGRLLHQDKLRSVVEMKFAMSNAFHKYEDITEANLKISVPDLSKSNRDIWKSMVEQGVSSLLRFTYEIFLVDDANLRDFKEEISRLRQNTELNYHQQPLITKSVDVKLGNTTRNIPIDVTMLVKKWRENYLRKKTKRFQSAFLFITTDANFSSVNQCISSITSTPKLVVTSHDRRQCPLPSSSYDKRQHSDKVAADATIRVKRSLIDNGSGPTAEGAEGVLDTSLAPNLHGFNETQAGTDDPKISFHHESANTAAANMGTRLKRTVQYNGRKVGSDGAHPSSPPLNLLQLNETRPEFSDPKRASFSRSVRSTICKRHPLYLRFDDVGWGQWIIAPAGIQAYKCSGDCPFPLVGQLSGTNHALLLNLMSSFDPHNRPAASCVPSTLSSLPLLYFDRDGVVVLRQYEDMVVQTCACR